jgi:uncharacterized membrane protein
MGEKTFVHLFHIFFVGMLFLYIGITQKNNPTYVFNILFGLGIIIVLYHIYKAYLKIKKGNSAWVNFIHIFLIGPLLIVIGYYGKDVSRKYFELLLMAGMASIGYHGYYLFYD